MKYSYLACVALVLLACQPSVDREAEKNEIITLMTQIEKAHFNKSAEEFYAPYDEQWTDVRSGNSRITLKEDELPRTQAYLEGMEFDELVARGEPIVELSDDGRMASFIGAVTLKGRYGGEPVFWAVSWQSVLRKRNGQWKIISTANTEAGPGESAAVLLDRVRQGLGEIPEELVIYAKANCKGPDREFTTLMVSGEDAGRMEQQYGEDHMILGHDATGGWMVNAKTGDGREAMDTATRLLLMGHEMHLMAIRPELRHAQHQFIGFEQYDGKDAFVIEARDALEKPVRLFYDFDTYLPLGFTVIPPDESGEVAVTFADWEVRDKCNVFTRAIIRHGDAVFTYDYTDITLDADPELLNNKGALLD